MDFVFVPNYSSYRRGVDGRRKAIINSHVTSHHHRRRYVKGKEKEPEPQVKQEQPLSPQGDDKLVLLTSIEPCLPFPDYGTSMGSFQRECIHHFVNVMALSWLPAKGQHRNLCDWLLPFTLSHPVVQNTFIASAAAHLLARNSDSRRASQLRIELLRVKTAGLEGIKKLLGDASQATSLATVSAISGLMAVELYEENGAATKVHTDGMRKILEKRGGFSGVRTDVAEMIAMLLFISAGWSRSLPAKPYNISHRPIPPMAMTKIALRLSPSLNCLGQSLMSPTNNVLDSNLRSTARQLSNFIKYREFQYNYPHSDLGEAEGGFTASRLNLEYTLLAHPFQQQHDLDLKNPREEVCRVAMLIFISHYNQLLPLRSKFWNSLAAQLMEALESTDIVSSWNSNLETLQWALYLGALATTYTPERQTFIGYLAAVSQDLGFPSWQTTQGFLRTHFYIARLHGDDFYATWREAQPAQEPTNEQIYDMESWGTHTPTEHSDMSTPVQADDHLHIPEELLDQTEYFT